MNIPERIQALKDRFKAKTYDHLRPNRGCNKVIGMLKAERLRIKNLRRAENGLPPKNTYAEI